MAQSFGVGGAIKSWFGLFTLFLEASQIAIEEHLHASAFSDIATSRELLRRQLQRIASSRSSILSSDRKLNNLPFEFAGVAAARRVDPLEIMKSSTSLTKEERRRTYRRKRSAHRNPPVVEPRPFNQPSPTTFPKKIRITHCRNNLQVLKNWGLSVSTLLNLNVVPLW